LERQKLQKSNNCCWLTDGKRQKVVEAIGFKIAKSIVLVRDNGMDKKALYEDIMKNSKPVMRYVSEEDVGKAKALIVKRILE